MKTPFFSAFLLIVSIGLWPGLAPGLKADSLADRPALAGNESSRSFAVQSFEQIKITETLVVTVKEGKGFSVEAVGRPEDINQLDVTVKKGILSVAYQPVRAKKNQDVVINREEVKLTITLPTLKKAEFQKSARFTIEGFPKVETLELVVNSLASGSATVQADHLKLTMDSRATVALRGETARLDAQLQGQSELTAFSLDARQADLQVGGMSKAKVSVRDKLQAASSGSSEILYKGKPDAQVSQNDFSSVRKDTNQ